LREEFQRRSIEVVFLIRPIDNDGTPPTSELIGSPARLRSRGSFIPSNCMIGDPRPLIDLDQPRNLTGSMITDLDRRRSSDPMELRPGGCDRDSVRVMSITRPNETVIVTHPVPTPRGVMCQSCSHGHHHHGRHHSHRTQPDQKHAPAHHHVDDSSRLTRRQALGRLKAAGLVAAASASPWSPVVRAVTDDKQAAPAAGAATRLFDFKQVPPGSFGAIARPTALLNCNAAVIVNRDHVLVVDTHSKPSAAKALIRQIREEVTELPVRYVVDSHLHGDHAMGNEAYPEVFG